MESWQQLLRKQSIASLEALVAKFGAEHFPDLERLQQAAENFEFRISPAMVDLIKSPGDPIWRQYVPDLQELEVDHGLVDSLAEDAHSPVPNITHRYPDRALFLVSPVCAAYCRFCTRRRKVGDPEKIPMAQLESAFRYLEEHVEIRDVIMSGGDPLLLSDRRIDELCMRLRAIPHLEVIRIGSRAPGRLPERTTPAPARLDLGARRAALRDRRARGWWKDPAASGICGVDQRRRGRAQELRGETLRIPATRNTRAPPADGVRAGAGRVDPTCVASTPHTNHVDVALGRRR